MLTVDYQRLGLAGGERVLDVGAGAGRHAFEAYRRGGRVVACDLALDDLQEVASTFAAMSTAGDERPGASAACVNGDATRLPYPDGSFDRIIAAEILEHVPDDAAAAAELARVLRPGGSLAVTVPAQLPERICWALSHQYHAPYVEGGHVRIYSAEQLRQRLRAAGLVATGAHRAHALHSPYWWLKCAVGPTNDHHPLVRAYHRLLVWDITKAPTATRVTEQVLNPMLGKSLVVYATKAVRRVPSHRGSPEAVGVPA